jgi:hypothetical protein
MGAELYSGILRYEFLRMLKYDVYNGYKMMFQHGSNLTRTSRKAHNRNTNSGIVMLHWLHHPLYQNPIENLWQKQRKRLAKYDVIIRGIRKFCRSTQRDLNEITPDKCRVHFSDTHHHIVQTIEHHGGQTDYQMGFFV